MITNYTTPGTVSSVLAKLLRGQRITQQHGDGHRANASGYGCDKPGVFPRPVEVHISGQLAAIQPRDTDVHDDGAWAIIHRCTGCGTLRTNRIAGDDQELALLQLALRPLANPPFPLDGLPVPGRYG